MKWVKRIALWGLLIASVAYGISENGILVTAENIAFIVTWYYIGIGVLMFFLSWLPRYRAVKRLKRKGLLYLALIQEQLATK